MESADERRARELYEKWSARAGNVSTAVGSRRIYEAAILEAITSEREACSILCHDLGQSTCAAAIRSRTSGKDGA